MTIKLLLFLLLVPDSLAGPFPLRPSENGLLNRHWQNSEKNYGKNIKAEVEGDPTPASENPLLSAALKMPTHDTERDYVTISYDLTCTNYKNFKFEVSVWEFDAHFHDMLRLDSEGASTDGKLKGVISTSEDGDGLLDDWYEFVLKVAHTCHSGSGWKRSYFYLNYCKVGSGHCKFNVKDTL